MEELVKHFLPEDILNFFTIVKVESGEKLIIHLEEKNVYFKLENNSVLNVSHFDKNHRLHYLKDDFSLFKMENPLHVFWR